MGKKETYEEWRARGGKVTSLPPGENKEFRRYLKDSQKTYFALRGRSSNQRRRYANGPALGAGKKER